MLAYPFRVLYRVLMGSHRSAGILNKHIRTANFMLNGNTCKISLSHWHAETLDVHVAYSWKSLETERVVKPLIRCTCLAGSCNTFAHVYFRKHTHTHSERSQCFLFCICIFSHLCLLCFSMPHLSISFFKCFI